MSDRREGALRHALPESFPTGRQTTVLFADVTAPTPAADDALVRCTEMLRQATESCGGRVVKTLGNAVMALFASADAAAGAATQMHLVMESLLPAGHGKPALRIAFHSGPVIQRDNDIFGDTVNLASRLVQQATNGQVLTSDDTTSQLSPIIRRSTRHLYPIRVKGKAEEVALCELVWRQSPDLTDLPAVISQSPAHATLRLRYKGHEVVRRRARESILIGRDDGCELVISGEMASRHHCTIERRQDRFVLQDDSTNGTYITVEGEHEIAIHREDFSLRQRGWLAFGQPRSENSDIVEYFCE
jgi:adenylate cyclase